MNDVRRVIYGTIIGFFLVLVSWLSIVYISACGFSTSCNQASPLVIRTPIPTLIPAKPISFLQPTIVPSVTPAVVDGTEAADEVARPSIPGGPGSAINLTGNLDSGKEIYVANCERCHGADGAGGIPNPGTEDGTVPPLNPIDDTLVSADYQTFATNIDLFIEHGSTAAGSIPNLYMPAWGDRGALTPQEIADVIAYIISLNK